MSRRFIPMFGRVLVQKAKTESKTASGILLPEAATQKINEAVVVQAGTGIRKQDGEFTAPVFKNGETVLLSEYAQGTELKLGDKEYTIVQETDILGKLE